MKFLYKKIAIMFMFKNKNIKNNTLDKSILCKSKITSLNYVKRKHLKYNVAIYKLRKKSNDRKFVDI